ncbi:MAG: DUF222 domain-containing protein [Acidimicrobiia bacterium]
MFESVETGTYTTPDFSTSSNDAVRDFFCIMQAVESFAQVNKLAAAAEMAAREATDEDGAAHLAQWLELEGRHNRGHANTQARVATALVDLPAIAAVYADGQLSFDQVAELTKFADAKTDAEWAERAPAMSPGQLRHEARRHNREEKRQDADKSGDNGDGEPDPEPVSELHVTHRRDGRERITADLTPADAAHLLAALDRQAERYGKDPDTKQWAPLAQRRARALVDLATAAEPSDRGDRATAVVHIDWQTLAGLTDTGSYVDLPFAAGLAAETARAMACDGKLDIWVDNPLGATIGIGRASPIWPPWLARKILHRDKTCRWPGCNSTIGLQIHHDKPFGKGGKTNSNGGFCLCSYHHRLRHKPGWQIRGNPDDLLTFIRPDGTILGTTRPPLPPDIRERVSR